MANDEQRNFTVLLWLIVVYGFVWCCTMKWEANNYIVSCRIEQCQCIGEFTRILMHYVKVLYIRERVLKFNVLFETLKANFTLKWRSSFQHCLEHCIAVIRWWGWQRQKNIILMSVLVFVYAMNQPCCQTLAVCVYTTTTT